MLSRKRKKTNGQIRAMFALAKPRAELHDQDIHEYLGNRAYEETNGRTRSLADLSFKEANQIITRLGGTAFRGEGLARRTENYRKQQLGIKTIETDAQLKYIDELAAMRNWTADSLIKFCNTVIKKDSPTTTEEGNKIVEGLKAMNRRDGLISFPMQKPARSKGVSTEPKFRRVA